MSEVTRDRPKTSQPMTDVMVVCSSSSHFEDDVHTVCSKCGKPIVHRPYVPEQYPKICIACTLLLDAESNLPATQ